MPANDLRKKPRNTVRILAAIAAILWAALIFILSAIPASGYPSHPGFLNYVAHFCEYLIFAVLLTLAFNNSKRALWKSAVVAVIIASAYAVTDELHQYITNLFYNSGRQGDPVDWLTDTIGALTGAILTVWFISSKKVKTSRAKDEKRKSRLG
jgi:VanZ family protein